MSKNLPNYGRFPFGRQCYLSQSKLCDQYDLNFRVSVCPLNKITVAQSYQKPFSLPYKLVRI